MLHPIMNQEGKSDSDLNKEALAAADSDFEED
jgi:hypothetical protein